MLDNPRIDDLNKSCNFSVSYDLIIYKSDHQIPLSGNARDTKTNHSLYWGAMLSPGQIMTRNCDPFLALNPRSSSPPPSHRLGVSSFGQIANAINAASYVTIEAAPLTSSPGGETRSQRRIRRRGRERLRPDVLPRNCQIYITMDLAIEREII